MSLGIDVMMLAAGKSERIQPLARGLPKPLLLVAGRPILEWNLCWLAGEGIGELWINLHHGADAVREAIGDGERFGLAVRYSFEPELLGTAGAVRKLASEWRGTVLVVYGDSLISFDVARFLAAHRAADAIVTIALFDQAVHAHTGIAGGRVAVNAAGRITGFVEGRSAAGSTLVNAGAYLLEPPAVAAIPDGGYYDFGHDLFPALLRQGSALAAYVLEPHGFCLGLDTPASFAAGVQLIEKGKVRLA